MTRNFADAGPQYDGSALIPHGTICRGVLSIKPYNMSEGMIATPSKSSNGAYLNCDITVEGGTYDKRHVFTRIGVAGSEKYINMGRASIKAIMEFNGAHPQNNPQGYELQPTGRHEPDDVNWMDLDGASVAFKVKVQKGNEQYPDDKNEVAVFLTPLDPSVKKDWDRFMSGDVDVQAPSAKAAAPQQSAPAWGGGAAPQQSGGGQAQPAPQQQPAPQPATSTPPWLAQQEPFSDGTPA